MNELEPRSYPKCYRPLEPGFIRVFELETGHPSDPIVGRLVPQLLGGEPYEAVSYVWGDPNKRCNVIINGVMLSVTVNLHGALTAFRHPPMSGYNDGSSSSARNNSNSERPRPVRRLWADALCINQNDLAERTSQVELMGRIFAGAARVLAWLGWEEGEEGRQHTLTAIHFIHSFMDDPNAALRKARILLLHHGISVACPASRLTALSVDDRCQFEEQALKWEAVKIFFDIEYFHRGWIVQELGLAREAILYTALKPAVAPGTGGGHGVVELHSIKWRLLGQFAKFLDYRGASLVTHLNMLSWVATHIVRVWGRKQDGTPTCNFLSAMHWVRTTRVTDARDRVYSLLGHPLADLDGQLVMKPNYTVTRGVVYTQLAANFIRQTRNLYAVALVDHDDDPLTEPRDWDPRDDGRMPSWVPDWHSIARTTPLEYPVSAAKAEDADIRIDGGTEGAEGTPLPHLLVRGWVMDEIVAVSQRMETTDFPVTQLTRESAKQNPFWLDRIWEVVFPASDEEGISEGRDALAVLETLSLALPFGTRERDQPVSPIGPQQTLAEHRRSFAAYVLEYHELRHLTSEASGIDDEDDTWNYNLPARSLYGSLPAEAQAELRRLAEGATGEAFVECITWPSMCRVVYRTASGLVGVGSRISRPGDLVCRLRGSSVLMTLRPIKDAGVGQPAGTDAAPISCAFVGSTVVPARIKKDVIDGQEFGEKAAHFRIV